MGIRYPTLPTAQKMEISNNDFFNKCELIYRKLRTCLHLLKNFHFLQCLLLFLHFTGKNICEEN